MTDTPNPTPEAVASLASAHRAKVDGTVRGGFHERTAAMLEALAADLAAQKARAGAAEAKVAKLVEAATNLHRSMELFFEADEAADEAERDGQQKEAARLRNMAHGRWQGIPAKLDALGAAIVEVQG